jgi:hypothetical protein
MEENPNLRFFKDSYNIHKIGFDGIILDNYSPPALNSDGTILYYIFNVLT